MSGDSPSALAHRLVIGITGRSHRTSKQRAVLIAGRNVQVRLLTSIGPRLPRRFKILMVLRESRAGQFV